MITQQLMKHGQGLAQRFGMVKVLGCAALGCFLPVACTGFMCCGLLLLLLADWW